MYKRRKGFTLMEMVLVMVLIAILVTGVALGYTSYIDSARIKSTETDLNKNFYNFILLEANGRTTLLSKEKFVDKAIENGFEIEQDYINADNGNEEIFMSKNFKKYRIQFSSNSKIIWVKSYNTREPLDARYQVDTVTQIVTMDTGTIDINSDVWTFTTD